MVEHQDKYSTPHLVRLSNGCALWGVFSLKIIVMKVSEFKEFLTSQAEMEIQKDIPFMDGCNSLVFEKLKEMLVNEGLDVDKRRHYETSLSVFKCEDGFVGIREISQVYSESTGVEDCYHTPVFVDMKKVTTETYVEL